MSVPTNATTWRTREWHACDLLSPSVYAVALGLERLADAEVEAEGARLLLAVDHQARESDSAGSRRRRGSGRSVFVAKPRADVVAQVVQVEVPRLAQTLPPSRKSTAPKFRQRFARSSVEKFMNEKPPIGRPDPLSGDTS